ncbi:exodeoxyribonuclease VII large subunit [Phaeobacter gallaeciensis]|jgi:exodeoxyribonuclease VII large subunit|uniref:exodeoxyribonuclease VII large subunit n=1 Tax=Phaeobacter gallaeciensis TaxID=60890 RepID=UPI00237FB081|nr:exodeoxyribonuclease VII large subunit [Phaeobacter gallaeciensis]MDE4303140.1 exodeoxyribonuclease VII large subunit [Phaeobacter gallaeciensis]MDE4307532.1 exodeoxyribonuclease VII large subunit [Phaeobacter gallaeciensis]MDE4311990.1 exodeoxyribonuclease VII large subunit [Phaeobacter gallaeciensis]MDE4316505.1 exodeoxyribonuclease VII large subunit [Phaeobacter gallaeciensis]MDE4320924.1 exodeoxyribonuclease VII large subunit [Phaeobacter gallaeciensis]
MSDLLDDPTPGQNAPEFTVSEISGEVKRTLESTFGRIRVRGEVGRVFKARSGHLYYDIKDDRNVLACTTWKGQVAGLSVVPEEGLEVIVTGRLTAFGAQSKYNMNVEEVAVAGQGALMALLEKRKKQLEAEGLFAPERKKPLPYLPGIIGVVTSPSGAVIRDILHRLRDRFPRKVLVWPVAVQGSNCAPEVTRAIEGFNRMTPGGALPRPDLIIVARGGGSIEDLWGFNEEIVARAAAASDIPLISAVGHETDTTLIDFVSDRRAPTPTAAAELAVPVRLDLLGWSENQGARLARAAGQAVQLRRQRLNDLSRALPRPETLLETPRQRLDQASDGLPRALTSVVQRRRVQLSEAAASLRPSTLRQLVAGRTDRLRNLSSRLSLRPIQQEIQRGQDRITQLGQRLDAVQRQRLDRQRQQLSAAGRQLEILSYKATLERGYAVVRSGQTVITTRAAAEKAGPLEIEFKDGRLDLGGAPAPATKAGGGGASAAKPKASKPKAKPKSSPDDGEQGSLF